MNRSTVRPCVVGLLVCAMVAMVCMRGPAFAASPALLAGPGPRSVSVAPALIDSLSSASTRTYREPDGSFRLEAWPSPVNFKDANGHWQPIDNDLQSLASGRWSAANAAGSVDVEMPRDAGAAPVRVNGSGGWVSMQMDGLSGPPTVDGPTAEYDTSSQRPADHVDYDAQGYGVKESIVLTAAPTVPVSFDFDLAMSPGLTPSVDADGGVDFKNGVSRWA